MVASWLGGWLGGWLAVRLGGWAARAPPHPHPHPPTDRNTPNSKTCGAMCVEIHNCGILQACCSHHFTRWHGNTVSKRTKKIRTTRWDAIATWNDKMPKKWVGAYPCHDTCRSTVPDAPPPHVMVAQAAQMTQVPLILVHEPLGGGPMTQHRPSPRYPLPLHVMVVEPAQMSQVPLVLAHKPLRGGPVT